MASEDITMSVPGMFYAKLASLLAGIVAIGFLSWAGVVWNGTRDLGTVLAALSSDVRELRVRQEYMVGQIVILERKIEVRQRANQLSDDGL